MVVGIAAVATAVRIGMAAAGTGTENPPTGGGVILTVTALLTMTTSDPIAARTQAREGRLGGKIGRPLLVCETKPMSWKSR
jgi:hypothetical protein